MRLKRLELWWRQLWIGVLVRLMRQSGDASPMWGTRPHRVLFLRHDRAGDMILSTGVMRAIADSSPNISLDVLASPINASLIEGAGFIRDVVVFDKKTLSSYARTIRRLRRARYDAVIDCMVTAPSLTTLLLILATGARYRIGIAGRGNDAAFNITVPPANGSDVHMVDRIAALARAFRPDLSAVDRQPTLSITEAERSAAEHEWNGSTSRRQPRILINISAGSSERLWPEERYVAVMQHLRELSPEATMRVISSPSETSRAETIASRGGGSVAKTARIRDAIALVATADFVFTPDTSIAHAASAFQKPAVAIYGKGSKPYWGLYGAPGKSVEHSEWALHNLGVEPVLRAIDDVWREIVSLRG
jgi:ADP-heptose:LPS heptosyltransferase